MSNASKEYKINMCEGPIFKKLLMFAIPLMCSSILQLLFNAADIVVVGRFVGDSSLAAVGSTGSLTNLIINLFVGLAVGANVTAARAFGAKDDAALSKTVHTAMLLSVASGILLTFIGVFTTRRLLVLMQAPEDVLPLSALYLRIYFLGMTANMVYNFGSALLRAIGDTKRPFYFLLAAGIINVILNLIFVLVFNLGVAGVAIATVISQCISATLVVRCLIKEKGGIRLIPSKLRIDRDIFLSIIKIGLPAGFQGVVFSLSNVVIQSSINLFGKDVIAGNSAAANLECFTYSAMNAFSQATISFVSQNYGAGKFARISKIVIRSQLCVLAVGVLMGNLMAFFGRELLGIYSTSETVISAGMVRLGYVSRTHALCGMMDIMVGALRGIGYSIMPMIVSLLGACGLRILWIMTVFRLPDFHSVATVYFSYPLSWAVTFFVHVICFIWAYKRLRKYTL